MSDKYINASPGPNNSVIYETEGGKKFRYSKGDRPWRNNNPGNLVVGDVSKRNGAIGKAGGFAVFPNYEAGHKALLDSLKDKHGEKHLARLIEVYAPAKDGNNTTRYLRFLRKKTGIKNSKKIKDFTADEFEKLWKAIEQMEGTHQGQITECTDITRDEKVDKVKIIDVRKNKKGTIIEYLIESFGWVSKSRGIVLAKQGRLDAVVARSRGGILYLRSRPDKSTTNNLSNMG